MMTQDIQDMIIDYFNIHKSRFGFIVIYHKSQTLILSLIIFLFLIQMQQGKENEFGNFAKLLKRLQIDNVAIPELRQLKKEHAYLQKLRSQRAKIEQLKANHDHAQTQIKNCYIKLEQQRQFIEDQHIKIEILEERLAQAQQKRSHLENNLIRAVEFEREKQKGKVNQLNAEIQKLKSENKANQYVLFQMEDQIQRKAKQFKEILQQQRKKMHIENEQKISSILSQKNALEQENEELKQLVTRQHKALQLQNEQYQECEKRNEELIQTVSSLEELLQKAENLRAESEEQVAQMANLLGKMDSELSQVRQGQNAKDQVEELRKKVCQLAKGEIERIQIIVNEFE